jgi:hypothetical protein
VKCGRKWKNGWNNYELWKTVCSEIRICSKSKTLYAEKYP